jgi:hypothetical protein
MKTAHIIPRSLPGKLVQAYMSKQNTLEDGQAVFWTVNNGIPIVGEVQEAFDYARSIIVPISHVIIPEIQESRP